LWLRKKGREKKGRSGQVRSGKGRSGQVREGKGIKILFKKKRIKKKSFVFKFTFLKTKLEMSKRGRKGEVGSFPF
jgi:hypothetical protein